jgi:hypothetical protein
MIVVYVLFGIFIVLGVVSAVIAAWDETDDPTYF